MMRQEVFGYVSESHGAIVSTLKKYVCWCSSQNQMGSRKSGGRAASPAGVSGGASGARRKRTCTAVRAGKAPRAATVCAIFQLANDTPPIHSRTS